MQKNVKVVLYLALVLLIIGGVFIWEQQKTFLDPIVEQDATEMYGKVVYIEDFPKDSLYLTNDFMTMRDSVIPGEIGGSPETAFVPLIFDEKGILFTTNRFLALSQSEKDRMEEHYLTDLTTFQEISGWSGAQVDYAQVSVNLHGNPFWVFDPYLVEQSTGNNNRGSLGNL